MFRVLHFPQILQLKILIVVLGICPYYLMNYPATNKNAHCNPMSSSVHRQNVNPNQYQHVPFPIIL